MNPVRLYLIGCKAKARVRDQIYLHHWVSGGSYKRSSIKVWKTVHATSRHFSRESNKVAEEREIPVNWQKSVFFWNTG